MRRIKQLVLISCLGVASAATAFAQNRVTQGSIGGTVTDVQGRAITIASVTITGQTGIRNATTNDEGVFEARNLIPGTYSVKVEVTGFKTASVEDVVVFVGRQSTLNLKLEAGNISEVVTVTDAATTDLSSTAIGQNLNDQLFENIPVQRSVAGLFYLAPGVSDSGQGGFANPSIAGGSPLDNLYIADGVNITDSAFGGLGVFSSSSVRSASASTLPSLRKCK